MWRPKERYLAHPDRHKPHLSMWVWVCGVIYSFVLSHTRFLEVTSRVSSTQIFIYNNTLVVSLTWSFMRMIRRSIKNDCACTLEWDSHVCIIVYNQLCRGCRGLWSWFPVWWGEEFSSFLNRFFCPMSLGFDGISTSCMGCLNHWSWWVNLCLPTPGMIIPNAMTLYVSKLSPSRLVTLFSESLNTRKGCLPLVEYVLCVRLSSRHYTRMNFF